MTHPQPSVVSFCSSVLPHPSFKGAMWQVIAITGLSDRLQPDQAIAFTGIRKVTQARLLAHHGAEGMRRQFQATAFLVSRLQLSWDADLTAAMTEASRVEGRLAEVGDCSWAGDLRDYRASLASGRPLMPRTERMYVSAAAAFLAGSGVGRAAALTQAHLRQHLRRSPGQAANLSRFLQWTKERSGQRLLLPLRKLKRLRAQQRALLRKATMLLMRLEVADNPSEGRSLLAAVISLVHGVPLLHVLELRRSAVSRRDGSIWLWPGNRQIVLHGGIAVAFDRFKPLEGAYAFPGRNPFQPLSPSGVAHHLRGRSHPPIG